MFFVSFQLKKSTSVWIHFYTYHSLIDLLTLILFKAAAPGTILVIGIIAGALIAIILIVVIVLKMRTRSEGHYKVEETRTYQFATTSTTAGGGVGSLNIHQKVFLTYYMNSIMINILSICRQFKSTFNF